MNGNEQDHFICCPHSLTQQKHRIASITKKLTTNNTPPPIRKLFIQLIIHHYQGTPLPTQPQQFTMFIKHQN